MRVGSFTAPDEVHQRLNELASKTSSSKSEVIRTLINKESNSMQSASLDTIAKAESLVAEFFNKATTQAGANWAVVKFQAADVLGKYAQTKFPTLTAEAAMAKVAFEQDSVVKVLYSLVNLKSEAEFAHYKAALTGDV